MAYERAVVGVGHLWRGGGRTGESVAAHMLRDHALEHADLQFGPHRPVNAALARAPVYGKGLSKTVGCLVPTGHLPM